MSRLSSTLLVCPTLNPGAIFNDWLRAYDKQKEKPATALIIDSSSEDGYVERALEYGLRINVIDRSTFNHGGTRQRAIDENTGYEFVIFLTQDAILCDGHALKEILEPFDDPEVAAVCGRQLPRIQAGPIESHLRFYNYREEARVSYLGDGTGLKSVFISNSFAAYRTSVLAEVGGFPGDVIFAEDMYVAARLLMSGYKLAYASNACVYHSHDYSMLQEMKRYFDMGVFHAREPWIREEFGGAENEGIKFVLSEVQYLIKHAFWRIPEGLIRTATRYTGYKLGSIESYIPLKIKRKISMNPGYFNET